MGAGAEDDRPGSVYSVDIARRKEEIEAALGRVDGLGAASAFQHPIWLKAWFATAAGRDDVRPLLASVEDSGRGELAMLLPLVELREEGRSIVEFADLGITDYNAPLLGPAAPSCAIGAQRLWQALLRALPPVDVIRLNKMPREVGARPNPLALLPASRRSHLNANVLNVGSYADFERTLGRARRKELDRSWRVFARLGGTGLGRAADTGEALAILAKLEEQQRCRITGLGLDYRLDAPHLASFYRRLVSDGLRCGYVIVTALRAGEEIVAALLGLRLGESFAVLRISHAGDRWKACSPGRLVITRTMEELCREGCTSFDFTIGDYEFKRRLGAERGELVELTLARSWLGVPLAASAAMKGHMRRHPRLASRVRRLLQRGSGLMLARS
jgi:CelD/BcsL family acetyltransferase involved in cellulose biosynthesis